VRALLRIFFNLLYHQLAFAYDLVAWAVSFGQWKNWILEVVPFIKGTRTLELGPGPGHLQRFLLGQQLDSIALDESAPMLRLAKRNTHGRANLTRGLAQSLPFANRSFDTILATFPSEYFIDPPTLSEIMRCLSNAGRFVILPAAMPKNRFLSWLFRVTGQAPSSAMEIIQDKMKMPFIESGFDVEINMLEKTSVTIIVIVAKKKER